MNSTSLVFIVCFLSFAAMSSLAAQEQTMKPYFEFTLPYVDTAKGKNETITRAEIDSLWNEFKEREKNHREALAEEAGMSKESVNLQRDCEHAHWPFEGDEYKGVVVLFHGFSACPQQYHEVGPLMAKKGYEVFAPTIVGHGYVYTWNEPEELQGLERVQAWMWKLLGSEKTKPVSATDNFFALPYEEKYYAEYVKRVNEMMKKMPAPRVVVGLSLGGAVAMYTGATTVGKDSTEAMYERQLLTVPIVQFYHPAVSQTVEFTTHSNWEKMGKRARSFLPSWLVFDGLARMDFGWGPNCEVERTEGRAGICQVRFPSLFHRTASCYNEHQQQQKTVRLWSNGHVQRSWSRHCKTDRCT